MAATERKYSRESNVILDCDTGEDDALAILGAIANGLPIKYVVTSHGNTNIDNSTHNTSRLLSLAGAGGIKVIRGSSRALTTHLHKPEGENADDMLGRNGLCGVELSESKFQNVVDPGEDLPSFLAERIKEEGPTDYIVTGPCTNLARLLDHSGNPEGLIRKVYIMGGAVDTLGNSGPDNISEFNFYCDPVAAQKVLGSGLPISLVSWDVTSELTIPYQRIQGFKSDTPVGQFSIELMRSFFEYYGLAHNRNFELNDPVTVLAQIGFGQYRTRNIRIQTEIDGYGKSVETEEGSPVSYFYLKNQPEKDQLINKVIGDLGIRE